jgi:hypothetical protein
MTMLSGQAAIVTGAGGAIGSATAKLLARQGASVICADRNPDTAARTADAIALASMQTSAAQTWLSAGNTCDDGLRDALERFKVQVARSRQPQTAPSLAVPWLELSPSVFLVYVPYSQVLEVDLTVRTSGPLPKALEEAHGISTSASCADATTEDGDDQHDQHADCAAPILAHALTDMTAALLGSNAHGTDFSIQAVRIKLSVMMRAQTMHGAHEWHHIDVEQPSEIASVRLACPGLAGVIEACEAVIDGANRYLQALARVRAFAGMPLASDTPLPGARGALSALPHAASDSSTWRHTPSPNLPL